MGSGARSERGAKHKPKEGKGGRKVDNAQPENSIRTVFTAFAPSSRSYDHSYITSSRKLQLLANGLMAPALPLASSF
jgi:hypothetical protein